ncbi:hypothetical protein DPMN_099801 [Dreissena polymorpha]|uniref:Uncharacterized protein n=1 Tax=Dreissena polymorpha TaxID=45954 RepID=A0A9D4LEK3_DREPO|nr:hypothetical protein DPMN_099801 [Dreissena polymorpha]
MRAGWLAGWRAGGLAGGLAGGRNKLYTSKYLGYGEVVPMHGESDPFSSTSSSMTSNNVENGTIPLSNGTTYK